MLVTSRPYPGLALDVDVDHPLRRIRPVALEPSPHAAKLQERAEQDLKGLLVNAGYADPSRHIARTLLRLLAAAEGPLSISDLAALSATEPEDVESVIERVAQLVQPVGPAEARRFSFGHETLRQATEDEFARDGRLDASRERIVLWAEGWKQRRWPIETTPAYLLDAYPDMLASRDPPQFHILIKDLAFIEATVIRLGVDKATGALRLGARQASAGRTTASLARLLVREAHHLRLPRPVNRPGYTTQQLHIAALATADADLAKAAVAE